MLRVFHFMSIFGHIFYFSLLFNTLPFNFIIQFSTYHTFGLVFKDRTSWVISAEILKNISIDFENFPPLKLYEQAKYSTPPYLHERKIITMFYPYYRKCFCLVNWHIISGCGHNFVTKKTFLTLAFKSIWNWTPFNSQH
jgi:hypothetical protein